MSRGVAAEASGSDLSRPALVESYRAVHAISYLCFFLAMRHYILSHDLKKRGDGPPQSTRLNTTQNRSPREWAAAHLTLLTTDPIAHSWQHVARLRCRIQYETRALPKPSLRFPPNPTQGQAALDESGRVGKGTRARLQTASCVFSAAHASSM
jgi:hypothetical protein